ncbi:DUF4245 domain-containing protein [Desertihabitans brevis]|uniref:DUF4245 domain-containing protein n=1 Tax=Desertihabitans brevis TaxID=2268447 RepID=UPI001313E9F6|nr:DUF4245 domain-containing protein [Desertihabitans brevis]
MARDRNRTRAGDMFRSLAVILLPILVIGALLTRTLDDYPVQAVEVAPHLERARAEAPFPVLAPVQLPEGWVPTRATWVAQGERALNDEPSPRNQWTLGYLDPSETYLSVEQGDGPVETYLVEATREGRPEATSQVGEQTWQQYLSADGRTRSLVLTEPAVTTVVSGDVPYEELVAFAGTLSTG